MNTQEIVKAVLAVRDGVIKAAFSGGTVPQPTWDAVLSKLALAEALIPTEDWPFVSAEHLARTLAILQDRTHASKLHQFQNEVMLLERMRLITVTEDGFVHTNVLGNSLKEAIEK